VVAGAGERRRDGDPANRSGNAAFGSLAVAPLIVLLPLAFVLPAWGTAVAAAIVAMGLLVNDTLRVQHPNATEALAPATSD
jgi:hypothetical protein